jgi:capsule polysaccharide export protein KpsE/RkpR
VRVGLRHDGVGEGMTGMTEEQRAWWDSGYQEGVRDGHEHAEKVEAEKERWRRSALRAADETIPDLKARLRETAAHLDEVQVERDEAREMADLHSERVEEVRIELAVVQAERDRHHEIQRELASERLRLKAGHTLMREEIDGLKKRVEVERQIADGYARSASLEWRDKLEEEIRTLKKQHDEEMRALYERLRNTEEGEKS